MSDSDPQSQRAGATSGVTLPEPPPRPPHSQVGAGWPTSQREPAQRRRRSSPPDRAPRGSEGHLPPGSPEPARDVETARAPTARGNLVPASRWQNFARPLHAPSVCPSVAVPDSVSPPVSLRVSLSVCLSLCFLVSSPPLPLIRDFLPQGNAT